MLPLPTEYIASVCEIKTLANELVATGTIQKITPDYIEVSDRTGFMPIAPYGIPVKMNVFNSKSGFRVLAGKVYTSNLKSIRIVDVITLLDCERRHFFRVEVHMIAQILLLKKKTKQDSQDDSSKKNSEKKSLRVIIRNLSLGGTLFTCAEDFETGDRISVKLKINRKSIVLQGIVRRTGEIEDGKLLYGCEFTDVSEPAANALCAYIFQCQREQIYNRRMKQQQL